MSSAVCRESQPWNEMTHLLEWAERGQDDKRGRALNRVLSGDVETFYAFSWATIFYQKAHKT